MLTTAILTTAARAKDPLNSEAECLALDHSYNAGPLGDGRQPGKIACGKAGGWPDSAPNEGKLDGLPTEHMYTQWPTMDWNNIPGYGQLLVLPCSDGSWYTFGHQFAASENCRTNQPSEACSIPNFDPQTSTCTLRSEVGGAECTAFIGGRDINCDEIETDLSIPTFLDLSQNDMRFTLTADGFDVMPFTDIRTLDIHENQAWKIENEALAPFVDTLVQFLASSNQFTENLIGNAVFEGMTRLAVTLPRRKPNQVFLLWKSQERTGNPVHVGHAGITSISHS
jgi:hypothetical protein